MLLYLLRHASAQQQADTDSARELTEQGNSQADSVVGKLMGYAPLLDSLWCSPYARAQQTAQYVVKALPGIQLSTSESLKPGGDIYGVIDDVEQSGLQHLMLVGHNPFLSNLLSVLADGTMESHRHMGNATLCCLSLDVVAPGCAEIVYTLEP